jgi:uncharacterized protein (DUF433 family)
LSGSVEVGLRIGHNGGNGKENTMDWNGCELVEQVPERVGGTPVIKGTRIPADVVLIDEELGRTPEQTHEDFPTLSIETIRKIRDFVHSKALAL